MRYNPNKTCFQVPCPPPNHGRSCLDMVINAVFYSYESKKLHYISGPTGIRPITMYNCDKLASSREKTIELNSHGLQLQLDSFGTVTGREVGSSWRVDGAESVIHGGGDCRECRAGGKRCVTGAQSSPTRNGSCLRCFV